MTDDPPPKQIPHSIEAEEAVLGAVLINPDSYYEVEKHLQAEDFFTHRNRWIWEAITRLHERRSPVDFLTISEELDRVGQLSQIGGPVFLGGLINQVPTSLHAEAYAQIIEQTALRRRMLEAANVVARLALDESSTLDRVINESEKAIFSVGHRLRASDFQPLSQVLGSLYEPSRESSECSGLSGVPTGFVELDRLLQGLQPSDLVIVAGRPGTGKTSLLLSIAMHAARIHKKHIAVLTLETSSEQLAERLLAQETRINTQRIRLRDLDENGMQRLTDGIESLKKIFLFLDDTPAMTMHQVRAKCRQIHLEHRLDLIVVDYLQLISGGERFENRVQEVSSVTRQLKVMARELNVPVLAAAQLSRAVEQRVDKRPILSDLRESGSIEMDADVVLFLYCSEEGELSNLVDVIIAKHRNGPTGLVRLAFRKSLAMFENTVNVAG
jgi:replicative DNA helicase